MKKADVEAIADRYLNSVYRVAVNYCKNADDASDAVQNAFLKLLNTDMVFNDDEHVHRWLIRVTINECKMFWRSYWRRNVVSLDAMHEANENDPVFCREDSGSSDIKNEIWNAVSSLPPKYSIVLHLHYHEEYSVEEIAGILGLTPNNVLVRLHRGRKKLKTVFAKKGIDYEQ